MTVHPGEILREEYIIPLGLNVVTLAKRLRVPASRIHQIVHGRRAITADTALRLSRYFGTSAQLWMNLQAEYNMERIGKEK
jgi:addiction module HigA family antidote